MGQMTVLVVGLLVFLGLHSVRMLADGWRSRMLARYGEPTYKGVYSALALLGFGLVVYGFGLAREMPVLVWTPPLGVRHAASLLTLVAFVLLLAAYVPRNAIKARWHHPMVLAVQAWALAHLLASGMLAGMVLFGSFLLWAVCNFIAARRRDRAAGTQYPAGTLAGTALTLVAGGMVWALFAFKLHGWLIGIRPFG